MLVDILDNQWVYSNSLYNPIGERRDQRQKMEMKEINLD